MNDHFLAGAPRAVGAPRLLGRPLLLVLVLRSVTSGGSSSSMDMAETSEEAEDAEAVGARGVPVGGALILNWSSDNTIKSERILP